MHFPVILVHEMYLRTEYVLFSLIWGARGETFIAVLDCIHFRRCILDRLFGWKNSGGWQVLLFDERLGTKIGKSKSKSKNKKRQKYLLAFRVREIRRSFVIDDTDSVRLDSVRDATASVRACIIAILQLKERRNLLFAITLFLHITKIYLAIGIRFFSGIRVVSWRHLAIFFSSLWSPPGTGCSDHHTSSFVHH